jgi:hypothetical protein
MGSHGEVDLPSPLRANFVCDSIFCDVAARFCVPRAVRASRNARVAITITTNQFFGELARGIEDSGTDKNRTIHAFA